MSNQHKLDSSEKSPNTLLQRARDKEKRTAKLAKALFESASEFVDMIAEDGSATKNSVDEIQRKLTEFGKLLLPHSPEDSHTHLPENSVSSVFSEIDTTGQKKKKKTKKKKSHYDFSLIGVDLSSMIVELSTELQKHLHESSQGGTASLSIDLEMATQSALQGCLLMKALRQIASAEDSAKDLSTATIPEVQEAPSPRSKGGIVDKMVYNMTQGDLFGVAKSGDADNGLVTNTSLPFEALLKAYTAATAYISTLPVVEEPDEEVLAVSREDKMLIDTLKVSRFFVEDYISLVAVICTSASGVLYVTDNSNGIGLYSNIIQFLLDLKPKKEDMMVKLHVVCLCTMISIGHKVPACLEVFIQKGGIQWLAATMDGLFSLDSEVAQNLPEHEDYVDLCMGLLHLIVRNSQCRKLLFITPDDLASTVTIACQLVNCIAADASKALNGHKVNRSSATPPADILIYLVDSNELRSAVRSSSEVASLRDLFTAYENNEHTAAKLVAVKSVLNIIDATDPNHNTVVSSVSDLVYSVGVRNLVFDMLDGLKESTEVANYRDENPSYETTNLILEKYKLNSVV